MLLTTLVLIFLDQGDNAPTGTTGVENVIKSSSEKVPLIDTQLTTPPDDFLQKGDHVIIALSLTTEASEENLAIAIKSVLWAWRDRSGGETNFLPCIMGVWFGIFHGTVGTYKRKIVLRNRTVSEIQR
jgi:hypothetical protein